MTQFGGLYWIKETTTSHKHLPSCAFAQRSAVVTGKARKAVYTGLRGLLSVALELSVSWRSGAGGFSISPNITIRPMVDETKSPVFRLMTLMLTSASRFRISSSRTVEERGMLTGQVLRRAAATIIKLYHTNMCSVYDVNTYGESALHKWTRVSVKAQTLPLVIHLLHHVWKYIVNSLADFIDSRAMVSLHWSH